MLSRRDSEMLLGPGFRVPCVFNSVAFHFPFLVCLILLRTHYLSGTHYKIHKFQVIKYAFVSSKICLWWLKSSFQQPIPLLSPTTLFVSISHLTGLFFFTPSSLLIIIWLVSVVQQATCRMSVHCYFLSSEQDW